MNRHTFLEQAEDAFHDWENTWTIKEYGGVDFEGSVSFEVAFLRGARWAMEKAAEIAETTECQTCGIQHDGDKFIYKGVAERIRAAKGAE